MKTMKKCVGLAKKKKNVVAVKWLCPFPFGEVYFLLEQNLRGWTSIISGAVEVKRGLSDSCRFSWHPTVCRHQDPSPSCRSGSGVCLH